MRSTSWEDVVEVFDALSADLDRALTLDFSGLTTREGLAILQRCETLRRRLPAVEHPLLNELAARDERSEMGGPLPSALADRLHIARGEARRRVTDAALLGAHRALSGEALEPVLPATAKAQRAGALGEAQVAVIRGFLDYLPIEVDAATRARCETKLAEFGTQFRPDELHRLAQRMADQLHPDGDYPPQAGGTPTDEERARRRGLIVGRQGRDGMTPIKGLLDPAARAGLDAVLARWAAPGMGNPADEQPCVAGTPSQDQIHEDRRSGPQRCHDALAAMCRNLLASGDLGQHNGLPATIIVSTTLAELETGTGKAHTGGGSWLPMSDVLRLASHAHHYLRIYQGAKELALFHTRRLASPAQRIVLHAKERGCSHPMCPAPGYHCEVHHDEDYATTGVTDIAGLSFRCGPDHTLCSQGWKTRKNHRGETETLPPPHLDHGQSRTNTYHHPEKLLQDNDSGGSGDSDEDGDPH